MAENIKIILEVIIVLVSFILSYISYGTFIQLKFEKSKFKDAFKLISIGFFLLLLSLFFELVDSFYLESLFDSLQLITAIMAFIILLGGFRDGLKIAKKNA